MQTTLQSVRLKHSKANCFPLICKYIAHVSKPTPPFPANMGRNIHLLPPPPPACRCKEIRIYVFPEKEWRGLSPNSHIICVCGSLCSHVRYTYFPAAESANRSVENINRSQKHECRNCDCIAAQLLFWEYLFRIFGIVSLCGALSDLERL
jgi:hypothetical protein